jgi:hypothetical protein
MTALNLFCRCRHTQGQASVAARGGHAVFMYSDNGPLPEVAITYDTDGYNKVTWLAHLCFGGSRNLSYVS